MAYGNVERMWTLREYIKEYDILKAKYEAETKRAEKASKLLKMQTRQVSNYYDEVKQLRTELAEAKKVIQLMKEGK